MTKANEKIEAKLQESQNFLESYTKKVDEEKARCNKKGLPEINIEEYYDHE